jgi:ABC-type multidrug transport system ATPase subunit
LLTGKSPRSEGEVFIGGKKRELSTYAKLVGFVPQEDICLRELTVSDILMHSARMRLPKDLMRSVIEGKVAAIISFLGLSHVSDSIVGDEAKRGISGGQRKRVNIGMELVAEPSVLFLDEPTSGLDSSTALEVCTLLRRIAERRKLTVAAVIHSPSPSAFAQFHDLLLLGKGGQVVYMGPRDGAVHYFEECGFKCPNGMSESDFFMDVLSGRVRSSFDPLFSPPMLFNYWKQHCSGQPIVAVSHPMYKRGSTMSDESSDAVASFLTAITRPFTFFFKLMLEMIRELGMWFFGLITCRTDPIRATPSAPYVFLLCAHRALMQVYRGLFSFIGAQILHLGCGAFISIASQQMECEYSFWKVQHFLVSKLLYCHETDIA